MTAHPIDTEALREWTESQRHHEGVTLHVSIESAGALLDLLAAAEHRATRAEAQSAIRGRAVVIYRDRAREAEAQIKAWAQQYDYDMSLESDRADTAEARIKAVRELHQQSALIRRIPRSMRQGHDDDQPFHYCTGCDGARYPCDTIRALDATTTQETR